MKSRSLIIQRVARGLAPFIFIYGLHVALYGHISPGGGFPGGVILASAFIMLMLARGREAVGRRLPFPRAKVFDNIGALTFLGVGVLGMVLGGAFLANFIQRSFPGRPLALLNSGTIIVNNLAIALKIWGALFLAAIFLSAFRLSPDGEEAGAAGLEEE